MAIEPKRMLFSLETYERMVATGVLAEDLRVELIDGEIIEMAPISPDHSIPVQRLMRLLLETLGQDVYLKVQDPIRLPPRSEPQPDIVLAIPPDTRYLRRHPGVEDILLVIEVARESRSFDKGPKLELYARHRINEVWIVDVVEEQFEVHRDSDGERFVTMLVAGRGEEVSPLAFPDVEIAVDDILP